MNVRLIEVVPRLYIRGALSSRVRPADLEAAGVQHVISLRALGEPNLTGWVGYRHVPFADSARGIGADVDALALDVARWVAGGEATVVMCHQGVNRSGLVVALAVRWLTRCSGTEAVARLRRVRSNALNNPLFEDYVTRLREPDATNALDQTR